MVNGTGTLTFTYSPTNSNDSFTWSGGDESIVKVDQNGNVTALKEGKAVITVAATYGTATASCEIYVVAPELVNQPRVYIDGFVTGDDTVTVDIDTANLPNRSTVYVVTFDDSGSQLDVKKAQVSNGEAKVSLPADDTKTVKVFCWESLSSMRPLCVAAEKAL